MRDLRASAAALRTQQATAMAPRLAPEERGERLATIARGEDEQLRLAWDEFNGAPYLSIRVWRSENGTWWPDKTKGCSVRVRELGDFAEGIAAAIDRAQALPAHGPRPAPAGTENAGPDWLKRHHAQQDRRNYRGVPEIKRHDD